MFDLQNLLKRKRGAPIGNKNALKHGKYSPRIKAERWAIRRAEQAEERKQFAAYLAPIEAACRAQHAQIMAEIERERAELEQWKREHGCE